MGILSKYQGAKTILFFYYGNRNIPAKLKLAVIFVKSPLFGESSLASNMMTKLMWKAIHATLRKVWKLSSSAIQLEYLVLEPLHITATSSTLLQQHSYRRSALPKSEQ